MTPRNANCQRKAKMTSQLWTTATGPACSNFKAMTIKDWAKNVNTANAVPYIVSVEVLGISKTSIENAKMTHCNVPQIPLDKDIREK